MEFYNSTNESDGMSLEEMINCDIKSEFGEQNSEIVRILSSGPLTPMIGLENTVSTEVDTSRALLNSDPKFGMAADSNWMQNINVSSIQQLLHHQQQQQQQQQQQHHQTSNHQSESIDSSNVIMVNPRTGLPVQNVGQQGQQFQLQLASSQVSTVVTQPSQPNVTTSTAQKNSAIQAALLKGSPNIQYITINNISGLTNGSNLQNFGTQANVVNASTLSPMQVNYGQNNNMHSMTHQLLATQNVPKTEEEKVFPKPVYSYSCLIALALKNSESGCLPVSEIYNFMTGNFPYFKTAPDGWKNSVRHNLSLNKCFEKIENPKANGSSKKGCLWGLNPDKLEKMEEELAKWRKKDPMSIKKAMAKPEVLEELERGVFFPNKRRNKPGYEAAVEPIDMHSVIEPINIEPMHDDIKVKEERVTENGNILLSTVNPDDLTLLDNSLSFDPSISDLALQNELIDDLTNEVLKMESEMPLTSGPMVSGVTSPLTIISSAASESSITEPGAAEGYKGTYTYSNYQPTTPNGTQGANINFSVTRAVPAHT